MKRTLFTTLLVILLIVGLSQSVAQAGGWFKETSSDPVGDFDWLDYNTPTATPHRDFSTSSNKCRVCHAVHEAGASSWRLLKSGNTTEPRSMGELSTTVGGQEGMGSARTNECMYCHDATSGASAKKPYGVLFGKTVRGQHTLGATWIPDSSVNDSFTPGDGQGNLPKRITFGGLGILDCGTCHSVHGTNILTYITAWGWGNTSEQIDNYILRDDPAGNGYNGTGTPVNAGIYSIQEPPGGWTEPGRAKDTSTYPSKDTTPYDPYGLWKYEVQAAWCGDCHNLNPNITGPTDFRPNQRSHPLFGGGSDPSTDTTQPFAGGWMEVYGTTTQVSGGAPRGCEQCHMSGQVQGGQSEMSWPHQSEGVKLLVRSETATPMSFLPVETGGKQGPGDSNRTVPEMDKACLWCHRYDAGTAGVGITF